MNRIHSSAAGFATALIAITLAAGAAPAAGPKTFVSIFGNDTADCLTGFSPCRTAQRGIDQADPFGEVVFDTPGDFGTATVDKPLTLNFIHNGQMDVPLAGNPPANLIFNAANGDETLFIRGLYMNVLNRNANGIQVNKGNLILQNVQIQNGGGQKCGVLFQPNKNAKLEVTNSVFQNVGTGLCINGRNGADVAGIIQGSEFFSNNTAIRSTAGAGTLQNVVIQNNTISNNGGGVVSDGAGSNLRIKNTTVFANTTGLSHPGGGGIISLTGNSVTGNGTDGTFTGTLPTQ